jgi:hypothetical protein
MHRNASLCYRFFKWSWMLSFFGVLLIAANAGAADTLVSVQSASFRVVGGTKASATKVAEHCETVRRRLAQYWLEETHPTAWHPKCEIVIHATDAGYLAEVGAAGGSTVASSLVNEKHGHITGRRIDIRGTRADWQTTALPHELTHVVLADRFAGKALPRWADEGMAILADSADKRARHLQDFTGAMRARQTFRLVELMEMRDYPAAHRWGVYYGQSAAVAQFLVDRHSPRRFVEFVEVAITSGHAAALQQTYGIASIQQCEQTWQKEFARTPRKLVDRMVAYQPTSPRVADKLGVAVLETGFSDPAAQNSARLK